MKPRVSTDLNHLNSTVTPWIMKTSNVSVHKAMEATDCPYYLPSRPHKELQARLPIQTSPLLTSLPTLIFFLNIPRGLNTIFGYVISLPKTAQWLPQMFTSQASKWHSTYIPSPAQNPLSSKSIGLIPLHTILFIPQDGPELVILPLQL